MKVLKQIKNIFLGLLLVVFFAFALTMTILLLNYNKFGVTQFGSTSLIIINDEITSEDYKKGDLVIVENRKIEDIKVGDQIFAYSVDSNEIAHVTLGKIGEVYTEDPVAVAYENGSAFSMEYVAGQGTKVYKNLGTILSVVESQWGFLFIVLVPGFLIFIYELYALIVEIKYGDED